MCFASSERTVDVARGNKVRDVMTFIFCRYPAMRVAYIDEIDKDNKDRKKVEYFSVLMKAVKDSDAGQVCSLHFLPMSIEPFIFGNKPCLLRFVRVMWQGCKGAYSHQTWDLIRHECRDDLSVGSSHPLSYPVFCFEQVIYKIKLPGKPILGEGKAENQNHAIIFTRGEALQAIDMNQVQECF